MIPDFENRIRDLQNLTGFALSTIRPEKHLALLQEGIYVEQVLGDQWAPKKVDPEEGPWGLPQAGKCLDIPKQHQRNYADRLDRLVIAENNDGLVKAVVPDGFRTRSFIRALTWHPHP